MLLQNLHARVEPVEGIPRQFHHGLSERLVLLGLPVHLFQLAGRWWCPGSRHWCSAEDHKEGSGAIRKSCHSVWCGFGGILFFL